LPSQIDKAHIRLDRLELEIKIVQIRDKISFVIRHI
jgi:hypothetical protein